MANYIRFDWAMKRLLRNKANYAVLEGLLTTLLKVPVRILLVINSTPYADDDISECFRVDLLIANKAGECALVEIQNNNEYAYYQRVIFGLSEQLTDFVNSHAGGYASIRKVYSVNIVYFSLGHGKDFVYHGKTEFRGIHEGDLLELSPFQRQTFKVDEVSQLYPEYYILKVNDFNRVAKSPLEEWIYYLNTGNVPDNATAPGLDTVKKQLQLDRMSKEDLKAYYRHLDNIVILRDNIYTERAEGRAEGIQEGVHKTALNLKRMGMDAGLIAQATGLTAEEIAAF